MVKDGLEYVTRARVLLLINVIMGGLEPWQVDNNERGVSQLSLG